MKMIQLEFPSVKPAVEQILEQFKEWLVQEEDKALRTGIDLENRGLRPESRIYFGRNLALGDVREKLTELGVKFD